MSMTSLFSFLSSSFSASVSSSASSSNRQASPLNIDLIDCDALSDGDEQLKQTVDEDYVLLDMIKKAAKLSCDVHVEEFDTKEQVVDVNECAPQSVALSSDFNAGASDEKVQEEVSTGDGIESKESESGSNDSTAGIGLGFYFRPPTFQEDSDFDTDADNDIDADIHLPQYAPENIRKQFSESEGSSVCMTKDRCFDRRFNNRYLYNQQAAMTKAIGKNSHNIPNMDYSRLKYGGGIPASGIQRLLGYNWPQANEIDNDAAEITQLSFENSHRSPFHEDRSAIENDTDGRDLSVKAPRAKSCSIPGLNSASNSRWANVLRQRHDKKCAQRAREAQRAAQRNSNSGKSSSRKSIRARVSAQPSAAQKGSADFFAQCNCFHSFRRAFYQLHRDAIHSALVLEKGTRIVEIRLAPVAAPVQTRFLQTLQAHRVLPRLSFHGSKRSNMQSILDVGLSVPGTHGVTVQNGNAYGVGIYSSKTAGYSLSYSKDCNTMFICAYLPIPQVAEEYGSMVVSKANYSIIPIFLLDFEYSAPNNSIQNTSVKSFVKAHFLIKAVETKKNRKKAKKREQIRKREEINGSDAAFDGCDSDYYESD